MVGSLAAGDGAFEAFLFPDDVLAIYADPPLSLRVTGAGVTGLGVTGGYVEVRATDVTRPLTLRVEYGDRAFDWVLSLDADQMPTR